jgi:hypothetical protein
VKVEGVAARGIYGRAEGRERKEGERSVEERSVSR